MRIALLLPPFFIFVITLGFWWAVILMIIVFWVTAEEKREYLELLKQDNKEARPKREKVQFDRISISKLSDEFNKRTTRTSLSKNDSPSIKRVSARKPTAKKPSVS